MKKIFLTLLLMIFLVTGCGNEQSAKKIIIGVDDDFAPIAFRNEQNELVGFDVDLAKEAAKRLGVNVEFKPINWSQKKEEITSGSVDMIWNGLDITEERKEYMIFTRPYMDDRQILLVKKGSDQEIYSEEDLAGKIVGTQAGSTSENYLNENEDLKSKFADFRTYNKFKSGIDALKNNAINVFICDELIARYEMNQAPNQFEIIDLKSDFSTKVAIGFPKESTELRDEIQSVFDEMVRDGTAKKISEEWFQADLIRQ